ncbi:UDP-N-acetylmuramate dehydrogenase [Nocardioides massiliensis]|uniref:UDP-N-acetylenolpyruvoylglucosamine reductase n=1 Tax=Nocardioides massiliensis TaxID=1325935 RepID=A0ABT9NNY0_9ACTN|nr:UDP-N-acetylmuramate dehydrogenase [Nocardioides massiliensis]MDP9821972.1 UDP-N-acetylmuramate dehydrogenase [Nocardioides massiliensis]
MPEVPGPVALRDHTTLRLGGPARRWVRAETTEELLATVRDCDGAGEPVLVLGGGSNVVVADAGFDGTVVEVATRGVHPDGERVEVAAGEGWDAFVAGAVASGWVGVEALTGIPGAVGATPIQNVGAYGQEVAQTIAAVRVWDRESAVVRTFAAADCGFGYRTSRFKTERYGDGSGSRYVVLTVTFQLRPGSLGAPVAYAELARALGVEVGQRAPAADVAAAVRRLRAGKGMVLDAADHDTWSAGSFFTNPLLGADEAARLPEGAPRFAQPDGTVKTSAAWLIQHAGFAPGHGDGPATLSTKHTLALTNRGHATTGDLLALAAEIRSGVQQRFGITLHPEPVLVGCSL